MENYIINENTVAILKKYNEIIIYNVDKEEVFNTKIKKIINTSCLVYGSNLLGRKEYAKKYLNIKYKVPIIISENKNIILLQINNFRDEECLCIVGNKILNYQEKDNKLIIKCINNQEFSTNISKYSFEKILLNYLKLNNYINYQNSLKFL